MQPTGATLYVRACWVQELPLAQPLRSMQGPSIVLIEAEDLQSAGRHDVLYCDSASPLLRRVGPIRRVLAQALRAKKVPRLEFRQDKPTAAEDEVDAAIAAARQQLLQEEADEKQFQLLLGHVQGQGPQDVDANLGNGEEHAAGRQRKPSAQLEADARQDKLQLRLLFEGMKDREELGEATPEDMQLRHLIDELMAQEQREAAASTGPQTGASEGHQEVALRTQVETMHAQHSASRLDLPDQQLLALVKQFRLESGGGTLSDAALRRILSKSMHAQFTEPA